MTIRKRGKRWPVEIYDPAVKSQKRYVGTFDTQMQTRFGRATWPSRFAHSS